MWNRYKSHNLSEVDLPYECYATIACVETYSFSHEVPYENLVFVVISSCINRVKNISYSYSSGLSWDQLVHPYAAQLGLSLILIYWQLYYETSIFQATNLSSDLSLWRNHIESFFRTFWRLWKIRSSLKVNHALLIFEHEFL